jgi:cyclic-di-GMP-binding biofilm dispersal mediator protein
VIAKSLAITSTSTACAAWSTVRPRFHLRRPARRSGVTPDATVASVVERLAVSVIEYSWVHLALMAATPESSGAFPSGDAAKPHPLAGASVLLVGATGGLGRAIGTEAVRRGALLTLVARSSERLDQLDLPGERRALDLRSPEACAAAIQAAIDQHGCLDVVINAAGVVAFGNVDELSIDTMEELFLTNTFLPIMLARAALPQLQPGGAIVNISGVIAETNLPGMAAYGASKAAVRAFDEALAREARRRKVRVHRCSPAAHRDRAG